MKDPLEFKRGQRKCFGFVCRFSFGVFAVKFAESKMSCMSVLWVHVMLKT